MVTYKNLTLGLQVRFLPWRKEQDVVFSLFGKASHCGCEEQGSIPGDNRKNVEQGTEKFRMLNVIIIPCSLFEIQLAYSSMEQNTALRMQ